MYKNITSTAKVVIALIFACLLTACGSTMQSTRSRDYGYRRTESAESRKAREQERLRNEYGVALQAAANRVMTKVNSIFSPNTGRNHSTTVHLYDVDITQSRQDGYVACYVTFSWEARSFLNAYNTCELQGWLYYFPKQRSIDVTKARFVWKKRNKHLENISDSGDWSVADRGIVIDL